jgi:hypothetical protein
MIRVADADVAAFVAPTMAEIARTSPVITAATSRRRVIAHTKQRYVKFRFKSFRSLETLCTPI